MSTGTFRFISSYVFFFLPHPAVPLVCYADTQRKLRYTKYRNLIEYKYVVSLVYRYRFENAILFRCPLASGDRSQLNFGSTAAAVLTRNSTFYGSQCVPRTQNIVPYLYSHWVGNYWQLSCCAGESAGSLFGPKNTTPKFMTRTRNDTHAISERAHTQYQAKSGTHSMYMPGNLEKQQHQQQHQQHQQQQQQQQQQHQQ